MRILSAAMLLALVACSGGAPPVPPPGRTLGIRTIAEGLNDEPCVEGPDIVVAFDELDWIDAFDATSVCTPGDIRLPDVDFSRRFGVVVWWGPGCPGANVLTESVDLAAGLLVVRAISDRTEGCTPAGGLESFLMVDRPLAPVERVAYVLDGVVVGEAVVVGDGDGD